LLAFSTVAHVGLFLVAAGCLTTAGTAGAALYVAGHAGVKCALFLLAGFVLNHYGSVDELDLHGRGRKARVLPWLFVVAGLGLAGLPPFGTGLGKAVSEEAGAAAGYPWVPALFVVVSAVTGGAALRATGRIYFGLGTPPERGSAAMDETSGSREDPDLPVPLPHMRWTMLVPILVLLLGALAVGVLPGAHTAAERAAAFFTDAAGYTHEALTGTAVPLALPAAVSNWSFSGVAFGLLSAALAVALAATALYADRIPAHQLGRRAGGLVIQSLRKVHSGHIGDYIAWMMTGMATLAAFVGLPLR
jgi:multicomponent Na+:H+ antiporter subunit D